MKNVVIVGGGIAGLVAALTVREHADNVYLIEKLPQCGGLLNSFDYGNDRYFDCGTHFAFQTGNDHLDKLLFDGPYGIPWNDYPTGLQPGAYFENTLSQNSPCADLRNLPQPIYNQAVVELLDTTREPNHETNLEEQLTHLYGPTVANEVFSPLMNKLCGTTMAELAPDSHSFFDLRRFIILDPQAARELKKSKIYDDIIAFHHRSEGCNPLLARYPQQGGMGAWPQALVKNLEDSGVHVRTQSALTRVLHDDNRVTGIVIRNKETIACDQLIWTIAPYFLLVLGRIEFESHRPHLMRTSLHNFEFDLPFDTDLHYINCYDPDISIFRVTLYPNFVDHNDFYRCTVEVIHDEINDLDGKRCRALKELYSMGIVPAGAQCTFEKTEVVHHGFPRNTITFNQFRKSQTVQAQETFENVLLIGRASGENFFMPAVINEAYEKSRKLAKVPSDNIMETLTC